MSGSIQALRERRAHFLRETRNLLDQHPGAKWGPDQQKTYDEHLTEIERVEAEIQREERMLELAAEKAFPEANREISRIGGGSRKLSQEVRQIFDNWLRGGDRAVQADQWSKIRNTMSTTTNSEGGYTVATEIAREIVDAMKDYQGVINVAEVIRTATGHPMNYPTSDGTSEVGELIGENTTATGADASFGAVGLNTFKYSSKIIACPIELLQDSEVDMEAFIRNRLRQRIGRIWNQHFTTGTGAGAQPNGVVTASSVGKTGATGETTTLIYDDLVDLIDSVDIAYQNVGCKWMFSQTVRKIIRKLKDTANRPIWTPNYDAGIAGGFVDQLLGYDVQINNDMPTPAANAKSIAFGEFSYYKVRLALEVSLFRFTDSAYMKLGQVGFLAWARAGGNLVDTNSVKLFQHSAT